MQVQNQNIELYLKGDKKSQVLLYKTFAPKMYGVCLRFAKNAMEADDILQEGFIKIFQKLNNFRNEGSFEGWIRRTIINTAINYYRRNSKHACTNNIDDFEVQEYFSENVIDKISIEELTGLIQKLPCGYRTVFNLNVIEGYTHKEIGKMLGISDNTSKSQLKRARAILQEKVLSLTKEKDISSPFGKLKVIYNKNNTFRNELLKAV